MSVPYVQIGLFQADRTCTVCIEIYIRQYLTSDIYHHEHEVYGLIHAHAHKALFLQRICLLM